jgi:hypothetical protein
MTMSPASEQRELSQIADGLRAGDRRFARRMAVREGVLSWAAPGRQDFLLLLALAGIMVLALLGCAQVLTRWVAVAARAAFFPDPGDLLIVGARARPGWNAGQHHPGPGAS